MTLGTDTLRLDSTGHYARTHVAFGSPNVVSVDTGRWSVTRNGKLLGLRNLPRRWPEHGRYDPKLGWHAADTSARQTVAMTIERTWKGTIALGVQPEIGWRYLRVR